MAPVEFVSHRQVLAICLIALGVLLRPNAAIAAPLLATYAAWPASFGLRRTALAYVPAALLFVAFVPAVYYGLLAAERQHPLHSILVFDLGGITRFSGENQFPVQWTAEQTELLKDKCYNPERWDFYWHLPPCPFVMQRLERADDPIFGTAAPCASLAACGRRASAFLSGAPRHVHVAVPRPLKPCAAGLGLGETELDLWRQPLFPAGAAVHEVLQPTILFGRDFGFCWQSRSARSHGRDEKQRQERLPSA